MNVTTAKAAYDAAMDAHWAATAANADGDTLDALGQAARDAKAALNAAEFEAFEQSTHLFAQPGDVVGPGFKAATRPSTTQHEAVYTVARDEWEVPCEHPLCALLHTRWNEGDEWNDEEITLASGKTIYRRVRGVHMKKHRVWLVFRDGVRVGDVHDTKREALEEAATRPKN